jgi:hypothetical protein
MPNIADIAQKFMTQHVLGDDTAAELMAQQMPWLTANTARARLEVVGMCWSMMAAKRGAELAESFGNVPTGDAALLGTLQSLPVLADELVGSMEVGEGRPAEAVEVARLETMCAASIIIGIIGPRLAAASAVGIVNRNIRNAK